MENHYHTIVITCGVSIFSNDNVFGIWAREREIFQFRFQNPVASKREVDEEEVIEKGIGEIRPFLKASQENPKHVSAEYSMMYALQKNHKLMDNPHIILFYTDTFE
jgi:hypothetical protein